MTDHTNITLTSKLNRKLGDQASIVQKEYTEIFAWMINKGKNPHREIGYNKETADNYLKRLDQLHFFVIDNFNPDDPVRIKDKHAKNVLLLLDKDEINQQQQGQNKGKPYSESSKRKFANVLKMYFAWRYYAKEDVEYQWEPKIKFSDNQGKSADRFTYRELGGVIKEAGEYGKLPSYNSITEEKREEVKGLIAQRIGKPKNEVTQEDWFGADWSAKYLSLVKVGYDAGLSPKEVANAEVHWFNPKENILRIPSAKACKEREKEKVAISNPGAESLSEWIKERRHLSKYDGTNKIWLNREGNPYTSANLNRLLRKLCREADIEIAQRKIVWTSLRQTMGRNLNDEGDLAEANDQLRHNKLETTQEIYNETVPERRSANLTKTHRKAERSRNDPDYNPFAHDQVNEDFIPSSNMHGKRSNKQVRSTGNGNLYIDAVIENTPREKSKMAKRILEEDDD